MLGLSREMKALPGELTVFMACLRLLPFCKTGRFPRCWRPQLGNRIQFLPRFILRIFSMCLSEFVPLVLSLLRVPLLLILHKFRFLIFILGFGIFVFLLGIQFLGTRWDSTYSS